MFGVDFSGAKLAGRNTWLAQVDLRARRPRLAELASLEKLAGHAVRDVALGWLVRRIADSRGALWGIDFPFGLPVEVLHDAATWDEQLAVVKSWKADAPAFGMFCVERSRASHGKLHIRRSTDVATKTPFDCYHYRIIYQTFHGMRDVLAPLREVRRVAIAPFDGSARLQSAGAVVVETCPSSTLKRLGLPHQNYKQPAGGALSPRARKVRAAILESLGSTIEIGASHRRTIMRNPGGDALDAVIAAVGTYQAWNAADHRAIAADARCRREGRIYA